MVSASLILSLSSPFLPTPKPVLLSTYLCWPSSLSCLGAVLASVPVLEMFSLQLSSLNQQGHSWCPHFPHLLLSVFVSVIVFPFNQKNMIRDSNTFSSEPELAVPIRNSYSAEGLYKVTLYRCKSDIISASPAPHLPTWMVFHCCPNLNFSVYQSKEMICLISILQTPSGIPQTSCVLLLFSQTWIIKSLWRAQGRGQAFLILNHESLSAGNTQEHGRGSNCLPTREFSPPSLLTLCKLPRGSWS